MSITRRDFLKGMAAGALGVAASSVLGACSTGTETTTAAQTTAAPETKAPETKAPETTAAPETSAPVEEGYAAKVTQVMDTDYVIIGSGMTGLTSAVEAAQLGMKVVVLEKNAFLGGSSNVVEGTFGLFTKSQELAGMTADLPSVSSLLKQTQEYHHYNCNAHAVKRFYEKSGENFDWLESLGVPMVPSPFLVPGMNNTRHAFNGEAKRGSDAIAVLGPLAESLGVQILTETPAKELIVVDGKVCGAYAQSGDDVIQINAKAVLVATGGYAANKEMLVKYAHIANGDFCKDCGMAGRDGDGINMALAAGGVEWKHMGVLQNFGPITKNDTYATHLYAASSASGFRFNEQGVRYADETLDVSNFAFSGNIMQQQKASYSIASKATMEQWATVAGPYGGGFFMVGFVPLTNLWEQVERDMQSDDPQVFYCETLDDVAAQAGVDAETLKASVARYDAQCAAGVDDDFMKAPEFLMPVGEGPYYLFKHCIGIFTTCDGMHVNEYTQVLNKDGDPIPGLFAGGMDAGGLMGDAYDVSVAPCSTQGWCIYCGRTAAQFVKENLL